MGKPEGLAGWILVVIASVLSAAGAVAATSGGGLRGRVLDPQGRPVPGARITLTAEATDHAREAVTDAAGSYALVELPPRAYSLVAEAPGLASRRYDGLRGRGGPELPAGHQPRASWPSPSPSR